MNQGKLVFAQIMEHLPLSTFRRCVARYDGEHKVKHFSCLDQYLCMAFAQLTWRESLRDIEACLRAHGTKLYHLGIRGNVARNTLANANARRDWRIYCDFAQRLIGIARRLYAEEPLGIELKDTVYALDSTTIDLCLSVFSRQVELQSTTPLLACRRPSHGARLRPDRGAHRLLLAQGLRSTAASHQVQRSRNRQAARIPDEQLRIAGTHDRPAVPAALAY